MRQQAHARAYSDSSAAEGLTWRKRTWFSAAMTQRNIPRPLQDNARTTARTSSVAARTEGIAHHVLNAAFAAFVVVVVVLITTPSGAG
jgi:hypothetical protein